MTIIFHPLNPLAPITSGIWIDALAPLNPAVDTLWYNTVLDTWQRWNGSAWIPSSGTLPTLPTPVVNVDFGTASLALGAGATAAPQFARPSAATVIDYRGYIAVVPQDIPRFVGARWDGAAWYDTTPTGSPIQGIGYLNEDAGENLIQSSEDPSSWIVWGSAGQASAAISGAFGDVNTILVSRLAGGSDVGMLVANNLAVNAGIPYVLSFYAKAGDTDNLRIYFRQTAVNSASIVRIDLGSGAESVGNVSEGLISVRSAPAPSGYRYYEVIWTPQNTATYSIRINPVDAALAGALPSSLSLAGVQFEIGDAASSYIPTSGAGGTRAADSLAYTGVDVFGEFAIALDIQALRTPAIPDALGLFGTDDSRGPANEAASQGGAVAFAATAGGGVWSVPYADAAAGKRTKLVFSGATSARYFRDGTPVFDGVAPAAWDHSDSGDWGIGQWPGNASRFVGIYYSAMIFDQGLDASQLATLSLQSFSPSKQIPSGNAVYDVLAVPAGGATSFTLTRPLTIVERVVLNGAVLDPADYSVLGQTLTFAPALSQGDDLIVWYT